MCLALVGSEMILGGTWTWHQRALDHTVKKLFPFNYFKEKNLGSVLTGLHSPLNLLTYSPLPHQCSLFPKSGKGVRPPELIRSKKTVLHHEFDSGSLLLSM